MFFFPSLRFRFLVRIRVMTSFQVRVKVRVMFSGMIIYHGIGLGQG